MKVADASSVPYSLTIHRSLWEGLSARSLAKIRCHGAAHLDEQRDIVADIPLQEE